MVEQGTEEPEFEFDRHTQVSVRLDGSYDVTIDRGWTVGPKPNGGYLLAMAGRAAAEAVVTAGGTHRDPVSATATYLNAPDVGPAVITTEILRLGRSASHVHTRLIQGDTVCVASTFVLGTHPEGRPDDQPWWTNRTPFELPPRDECVKMPSSGGRNPFIVSIMDRCDLRLDPDVIGFATGKPSGKAELRGWISLADGRPFDPLALLFVIDAFPPATFELANAGWVPTLSLTAYVRARPVPGPLRVSQVAQEVSGSRFDEVCEVWDAADRLVAQATQVAAIRIPEGLRPPPTGA